jgi:hypothetical protein
MLINSRIIQTKYAPRSVMSKNSTPGIRILGTGADTLNSVQGSYFERFHWPILNFWTLQTVEHTLFV